MENTSQTYPASSRLIHWVMAVLVLLMIPVGFIMVQNGLPRSLQNLLFISHKNVGVLLLLLICIRLANRWLNPPRLAPVSLPKAQELAAKVTHGALYVLLLIMPLSGYVRVRAGGFPIEALDALGVPALVPRSEALANFAKAVHFYAGYAIALLVVMHVAAALYHAIVRRDGIFSRMWPPFGGYDRRDAVRES